VGVDFVADFPNRFMIHKTLAGDFTVAPSLPLIIAQQRLHSPALDRIGSMQAVCGIGANRKRKSRAP